MKLREKDSLQYAGVCLDTDAVFVACSEGKVVAFAADTVKPTGRTAAGIIAKRLGKGVASSALALSHALFAVQVNLSQWQPADCNHSAVMPGRIGSDLAAGSSLLSAALTTTGFDIHQVSLSVQQP